jgi:hypothetical protein
VVLIGTGIFACLRRRRRGAEEGGETESAPEERGVVDERPPSYTYPEDKAELPEQSMSAVEMDGAPHSAASSSASAWKLPRQGAREEREDSPTVELPERKWRRTTLYELEENYLARLGVGTQAQAQTPTPTQSTQTPTQNGAWLVSPMTPGTGKWV